MSLILTLTSIVHAENFVLIVVPSGDNIDYSGFENRLRSELIAAGYATITATLAAPIDANALPANASRFSTNIAISISISDGVVFGYVSITDSSTQRSISRPVPGYPIGEQAPSVFAVRATDVLHGALLELSHVPNVPQDQPQPEPPQPTKIQENTKPPPNTPQNDSKQREVPAIKVASNPAPKVTNPTGRWGVVVGAVLNGGVQSMPIAPGGEVGLFRQERYWGVSADASAYLPVSRSFATAKITLGQWMIGGAFHLAQPVGSGFTIFESVGSGVHGLAISATAPDSKNERKPSYAVGYSSVGAGLVSNLNDRTALALRLRMLAPWRVADIEVRDETVARLAFPVVLGDIGLRVAF